VTKSANIDAMPYNCVPEGLTTAERALHEQLVAEIEALKIKLSVARRRSKNIMDRGYMRMVNGWKPSVSRGRRT
jgi:DNA replication initiation complex subunit (GINS family)